LNIEPSKSRGLKGWRLELGPSEAFCHVTFGGYSDHVSFLFVSQAT
jgi:hypothetical protein